MFPLVKTLAINIGNGPGCNSCRTQFMKRLVDFSQESVLTIELAYYSPHHSSLAFSHGSAYALLEDLIPSAPA